MPDNRAPGNNPTSNSAPGFAERPDYRIEIAPTEKRVRVQFAGETVADSTRALLLLEQGHTPVYYFPRDDVRPKLLTPSGRRTHTPFKAEARYWSVNTGDPPPQAAVCGSEEPFNETSSP